MCIEYLVRSMAALVVASSLDANGKNLGAETALAAMRRGFRLVVGGITTPRARHVVLPAAVRRSSHALEDT